MDSRSGSSATIAIWAFSVLAVAPLLAALPVASADNCTVWTRGGGTNVNALAVSVLSGEQKQTLYVDDHNAFGDNLWLEDNRVSGLQETPRVTCRQCGATITIEAVFPGDAHLRPYDPQQNEPTTAAEVCS